jgi:nucleoside-diphosphate-sugar epimerase
MTKIFITGGAGYVGTVLTEMLLKKNYQVTVLDLMIYGDNIENNNKLNKIYGDIRNVELLKKVLPGHQIVIHLACISNDPSFELNPTLGKSINYDSFKDLLNISKKSGIHKFIYASSSSVYGIKKEKKVVEDMQLEPLTDYSKYKALCEEILIKDKSKNFVKIILRPATVCGYSKRQRLDLVLNILTNLAYHKREIQVFGGSQLRPNIHIKDMCKAYISLMEAPSDLVNNQVFNVGFENFSVAELASMVKSNIGNDVKIIEKTTIDMRSYHVSSDKIKKLIKFNTEKSLVDAVIDLKKVFELKLLNDPLNNENYFNIKKMQKIKLL